MIARFAPPRSASLRSAWLPAALDLPIASILGCRSAYFELVAMRSHPRGLYPRARPRPLPCDVLVTGCYCYCELLGVLTRCQSGIHRPLARRVVYPPRATGVAARAWGLMRGGGANPPRPICGCCWGSWTIWVWGPGGGSLIGTSSRGERDTVTGNSNSNSSSNSNSNSRRGRA